MESLTSPVMAVSTPVQAPLLVMYIAICSCDTGYTLNGTAERTCQANGRWIGVCLLVKVRYWSAAINCTSVYVCTYVWVPNCMFILVLLVFTMCASLVALVELLDLLHLST